MIRYTLISRNVSSAIKMVSVNSISFTLLTLQCFNARIKFRLCRNNNFKYEIYPAIRK